MVENKTLTAALQYTNLGVQVLLLKALEKVPATQHGCKDATQDETQIRKWFTQCPDGNLGIATGELANDLYLFVIDADQDPDKGKDGCAVLESWQEEHGDFPASWVVQTPRGGKHLYYLSRTPVQNKVSLYPGIDVRGIGGYVVAPPSRLANGREYKWIAPPVIAPLAEADSNVYSFLNPVPDNMNKPVFSVPEKIPEGQRTDTLLKMVGSMQSKGFTDEAIRAAVVAENESRCNPPLTGDELERTVFPALSRWQKGTAPYTSDRQYSEFGAAVLARLQELQPEKNKRYGWHDAGNGNLFSDVCYDVARYVPERKKWYIFDGSRWVPDNLKAMEFAKTVADMLLSYTAKIDDETTKTAYLKHVSKWQQYRYRDTVLKDAASVQPVSISEFDRDPYLFNCLNGTLNLRSGTFHEHNPEDMLSKISGVEYHPDARSERWEKFIQEVTGGDKELAQYLQKALGYSLIGSTKYECFFILYGATSRNGKGTLCESFMRLMGDYGRTGRPDTIAKKKISNGSGPSEDIARLAGARFVNMSEPSKSLSLNAAMVKTLTGCDTISARFLNENSFEFRPEFKLFVNTNHLPFVDDATVFSSDRVKIVPFTQHFGKERRDMGLKEELARPENLSGILNWCIDGLRLLEREGFQEPAAVTAATDEYRRESDKLGRFMEEQTETGAEFETPIMALHSAYQLWCGKNGQYPEGIVEFRKSLANANYTMKSKRPNGSDRNAVKVSMVLGVRLRT